MSNDTKRTDEALEEVHTEEVLGNEEVIEDDAPSKVEDELNINELISKPKAQLKSKEERGGLSRKEVAQAKAEQVPIPDKRYEELQDQIADLTELISSAQTGQDVERIQDLLEITEQNQTEAFVRNALSEKSISDVDFNKKHKVQFLKERDELIADGMSFGKAVKKAMQYALNNAEASTEIDEQRAEGRRGAKLPPSSSVAPTVSAIKKSTLEGMPVDTPAQRAKYNAIMEKVEAGQMTII